MCGQVPSTHAHDPAEEGPSHRLTLVLKEQDLHAVEGEGLSKVVCHRVLLLLEDLGNLWTVRDRG